MPVATVRPTVTDPWAEPAVAVGDAVVGGADDGVPELVDVDEGAVEPLDDELPVDVVESPAGVPAGAVHAAQNIVPSPPATIARRLGSLRCEITATTLRRDPVARDDTTRFRHSGHQRAAARR